MSLSLDPHPSIFSFLAHIYIEPFTPPLPLMFCLIGAAITIILTFALAAIFISRFNLEAQSFRLNISNWSITKVLSSVPALSTFRLIGAFIFFVILYACFWGSDNPIYNIAPTFIWVIWWVGLAYLCAFIGDIWRLVNPWYSLFHWGEKLYSTMNPSRSIAPLLKYPKWIGSTPALLIFFAFAWAENVYHDSVVPIRLGQMIIIYSAITWIGMVTFGKDIWLRNGEGFTVAFGFLARFSPLEVRYDPRSGTSTRKREINLRFPGSGLIETNVISTSQMMFVLLLLSAVTFDGLMGTVIWARLQSSVLEYIPNPLIVGSLGLIVVSVVFIGLYLLVSFLMKCFSGEDYGLFTFANSFVTSLIPIALAYHVAHFLLFLLIQGQLILPLLSDPFGQGWNIFGTANYRLNFQVMSPTFFWIVSVTSIVIGHVVGVVVSHAIALKTIQDRHRAFQSQYPMLALMIFYTIASLWIITQPMYKSSM